IFNVHLNRQPWILGPTIRAEVNDKVIIHFKNLASRPYSIHPYGISYWKMSEGASYNDHTSASEKEDDVVKPKGEYVYVWEITDNLGPLDGDSRCLTSAYSSHVDQVRDFNSGLIGAILICKHGTLNSLGKQVNQQEFVLLFSVIDESKSWYLETDRIKYKIPGPRKSKRLMYSINGYINSSLPGQCHHLHRDVSWHLIAMGSVPNLFSIYFSGNGLLLRGHRVVSIELAIIIINYYVSQILKFLLSCSSVLTAGMTAYVTEEGICEEDSSHAPWQTLTWVETEEDEEDNDKDNFNIQMKYMMRTMSTKQRPIEWIHYITAEECDWDYAPSPPAPGSRSQKLERNPNRIGKEYKKAVYVEYTDNTFTIVKYKPNPKSSKGILGPVLRGEVGDRFKIVFKNLASRPYNLNPHGLTKIKVETAGDHHVMNHSVQPNEVVTYFWNVTESDGPTQSDPGCQTHFYFSSVDVVRDMASGLIGPMLICRKEMLNMNIDRSKYLLLSLFDENKSWYINENIQKYCEEPSSVNTKDPEFYQSNLMYSECSMLLHPQNHRILHRRRRPFGRLCLCRLFERATNYQSVQANHSSNNASQSNRMKGITSSNQLQSNLSITGENAKQTHLLLENQILKQEDIVLTDGVKSNHSIKWPDKTTTKTRLPKVLTFEQISNNKTEGTKLRYNETNLGLKETQSATPNWTSSEEHLATGPRNSSQDSKESDYFDYEEYEKEGSGDINETDYGGIGGTNFRTFADLDWCPEDWPSLIPRSSGSHLRHFFIAAIETIWDYKGSQTAQASKVQQLRGQRLGNKFKKVVFQQYMDNTFRQPVIRGEFEEHLGILGPVIIAEVNEIIVVKFKNMASKPFSIHAHGVSRDIPEEYMDEEEKVIWPRKEEDIAYPNETKMYIWHVTKGSAPTNKDFDCRAWTYYSDVNPERDIHSGLIGPLIVCKAGTLNKVSDMTPKVQEFSLLFLTFDENKSWYLEDNIQIFCKTPCHIRPESPTFRASNRFHTINGYVAETLPGLVMAQYRLVRWYLINMAMSAEIYSVHFHSQPFAMRRTKEHRMGVYTLFPGGYQRGQSYTDCLSNIHNNSPLLSPNYHECRVPLGLESGRIEDSQLTASSHEGQWAPRLARLQNTGSINAWRPTGPRPWIQVDLRTPMLVHGIITQGAKRYFKQLYVKKFYITYSLDTITWKEYKANSVMPKMVFVGNTDGTGQVKNYFNPPIVARYIRVYPRPDKNLALRMELLGCDVQSCSLPLGMEKRIIKDIQLSASSFWVSMNAWTASLARLKQQGISNAWVPKRNNPHEWLQINFLRRKKITGIITQGASRLGWSMFVKEYTISHSDDGITWTVIQDKQSTKAKVFRGNVDNNSQASNTIEPPIFAQYLRIYPQNWHRNIALRVEILGCETEQRF
uniref:F5/8 type C domain-containing protein n=1 Tax=Callorhinchus milii TaxID=7868 RepID=A0A4W3GTN1_CALMI